MLNNEGAEQNNQFLNSKPNKYKKWLKNFFTIFFGLVLLLLLLLLAAKLFNYSKQGTVTNTVLHKITSNSSIANWFASPLVITTPTDHNFLQSITPPVISNATINQVVNNSQKEIVGPAGPKGDTGTQGQPGAPGVQGPAGPKGPHGYSGRDGAPGSGSGSSLYVNNTSVNSGNFVNSAATVSTPAITWTLDTVPTPNSISLNVGAASAIDAGIITTGTQTLAGTKIFDTIGIGDSTPASLFTVGNGDLFQVNSFGAVAAATGITSSGNIILSALGGGGTQCVQVSNLGQLSGTGSACGGGGGGGSSALSDLTPATAINSIDNADFAQTWAWDALSSNTGLTLSVNSTDAASSTQTVLNVATAGANLNDDQATYGVQFSNTHTGNNATNIALYASASGGGNNYTAIFDKGNVGVGDTGPQAKLSVQNVSQYAGGTELVTNGKFDSSAAGWTIGDCVTYAKGQLNAKQTGSCSSHQMSTDITTVSGLTYILSFHTTNNSQKTSFNLSNGEVSDSNLMTGNHTYEFVANTTGTDTINFDYANFSNFGEWSLDNVSVQQATQLVSTDLDGFSSWSLGNCVTDNGSFVTSNYTSCGDPSFSVSYPIQEGHTYKMSFTVSNESGGDPAALFLDIGGKEWSPEGPFWDGDYNITYVASDTGTETAFFDHDFYNHNSTFDLSHVRIYEIDPITPALVVRGYDGTEWLHLGDDLNYNTGLGMGALASKNYQSIENTAFGANTLAKVTNGWYNTAVGANALSSVVSGGYNVAVGSNALAQNLNSDNVAIGESALAANLQGFGNIAIGSNAMSDGLNGFNNVGVGGFALQKNSTGFSNVAIGDDGALELNTSGQNNIAINALGSNTTGSFNIGLGGANNNTTGSNNVTMGYLASWQNITGSENVVIGDHAGYYGDYSHSTYVGAGAGGGWPLGVGDYNIALGYAAGANLRNGTNNIVIGNGIWLPYSDYPNNNYSDSSNRLDIGNIIYGTNIDGSLVTPSTGSIGIGAINPDKKLEINSATGDNLRLTYNDADGSAVNYTDFLTDSSGTLTVSPAGLNSNFMGNISTFDRDWGAGSTGSIITLGRNTNATNAAGSIDFVNRSGSDGFVWQDNAGNLRINTTPPANASDTSGTVVGAQTSTRDTKQDITDYTDYAQALNMVVDAPLHTFRYIKDVQGYGPNSPLAKKRIGYIADEVPADFMWGNVIDQVSVNGILMASVKALNSNIDTVQKQVSNFQGSGQFNIDPTEPIVIKSHLYLTEDSVGQAEILAGSKKVQISFSKPYEYSPIPTTTPMNFIDGAYRISDISPYGFTIELKTAQSQDVIFNWHAFASESAKLTVSDGSSSAVVLTVQDSGNEGSSPTPVADQPQTHAPASSQPLESSVTSPAPTPDQQTIPETNQSNSNEPSTANSDPSPQANPPVDTIAPEQPITTTQ